MKILMLHNYHILSGGEDKSFDVECGMLVRNGHEVISYTKHNGAIKEMNSYRLAANTIWNQQAYSEIRSIIRRERPDIMHCQNLFPLISPAVYYAAKAEKVPVVQTLRNYRLFCPNALLFREGHVCEICLHKKIPWPSIRYSCYQHGRIATAVIVAMLTIHRMLGTWNNMIDVYITLTEFARQKFIEAGIQPEKIMVKPNSLAPYPGVGEGSRNYAIFVGRLTPEKGIKALLDAWEQLADKIPLVILGDGEMAKEVEQAALRNDQIEWFGYKSLDEVYQYIGKASFLVFPSEWYETFGRVAIEAFAQGTPVVAANIGAVGEVTKHGYSGLHFRPGDSSDLVAKVEWLLSHPTELAQMRKNARAEYETKYTVEHNYEMIMDIYERAIISNRN